MRSQDVRHVSSHLAVSLCASASFAQNVSCSVTKEVTDPSGVAIAGATVTFENLATRVRTIDHTNNSGVYSIRLLTIGRHRLVLESTGFDKLATPAFTLESRRTAKVNKKLAGAFVCGRGKGHHAVFIKAVYNFL